MIPKKRCRKCGLPWFAYSALKWNENGTITANTWPWGSNFRILILPITTIRGLFDHLNRSLEFPVENILSEAQRHAGMAVFKAFYDKLPGLETLTRKKFMRRFVANQLTEMSGWLGMAQAETSDYIPGECAVGVFKNMCDLSIVSATVSGAFDLMEFQHVNIEWINIGNNDYEMRMEAAGEQKELFEKIGLDAVEDPAWFPSIFQRSLSVVPGSVEHKRCPKCNAPTGMSRLEWVGDGSIIDRVTNFRVVILDGYTTATVTGELARRIGPNGLETMVDIVRGFARNHPEALGLATKDIVRNEGELMTSLVGHLKVFPLFGYGNPVSFEVDGLTLRAVIDNPFDICVVAGTLQGLYEAVIDADSVADWQQLSDIRVSGVIEPA